ncbi:MAG: lysR [Hyphomicrobiales bacterium]|nr:lysR [Hyphomicrobiales bacterium]
MPHATSWDDFRLVKAIADSKSLVGAAEALSLNHSTVFRRLGALEQALGARLFERSRNGYAATAAGEEMIRLAARMEVEIVDFERTIAGRDVKPAGELRITTNDAFLYWLLGPVLASFRAAYPDIRLDIVVAQEALNLSRRDADVAIRATSGPPETLVGRRIGAIGWAHYAPEGWTPGADGGPFVWLAEGMGAPGARKWLDEHLKPGAIVCRVDTVAGLAHAVANGLGAGLLPCLIGDALPGVRRLGEPQAFGDDMWLLTHPDLRQSARVRAFMDHAGAELLRLRARIEGK